MKVSTHSRPKAAGKASRYRSSPSECFNTQPPEGGWFLIRWHIAQMMVSTHSRPKAAGDGIHKTLTDLYSFNTQPPEGGWDFFECLKCFHFCFNTQPPEGGWSAYYLFG